MTAGHHIEAIERYAEVLGHLDEDAPPEAFHSRLCEVVCELTSVERAVVFGYDPDLRQVRAVGAHGLDLASFRDSFLSVDSAPVARQALLEDRVVDLAFDVTGDDVPERFRPMVADRVLACAPMATGGRWVGVILADRGAGAEPLGDEERDLLWTLGKLAALAAVARSATRASERARQLQHRIDLAREVHDGVVQRLFGVSLALSADVGPLDPESRARCESEVQAALAELRRAVQRPLGRDARPTTVAFSDALGRLADAHADLAMAHEEGTGDDVPAGAEALAQSVLQEAVRNARKHANPTRVAVRTRRMAGALVLEVENDGVDEGPRVHTPGIGLRLVAFEALQMGGVLEFGPRGAGAWQVRLVVPLDDD